MTIAKTPMSNSYKAVFVFSILMVFVSLLGGSKGGLATWFWGYVLWMMYKRNNAGLVVLFKMFLGIGAFAFFIGFILLSSGTFENNWFGISAQAYYLIVCISIAIDFALLKYFENQQSISNPEITKNVDVTQGDKKSQPTEEDISKTNQDLHDFSTMNSTLFNNKLDKDMLGDESWNLAIKYDPTLWQAFTDIYKISPVVAMRFKDTLTKTKTFDNYSEIKDKFLKEALGLNTQQKVYFKNEFLNEIAQVLLSQNSLAAAEFIKLVSMYNLEASTDSADGIAKIFDWLKKVESSYKISVRDKLVLAKDILPESNGFQIKHKLYEKFENLGHVCYLLYNGNCAIVRSSEYRIYDSKKSAGFALAHYTDYDQWTVKNLVDKLDIHGDLKDHNTSLSGNASEEKKSSKKKSRTFKQIFIDVLINSEFAIVATGNLLNLGLFIFFVSIFIITILYEFGIFPAFIVLIVICGLIGGYYFFKQTKMEKKTRIIPCPKCSSKFRVPSGKHIEVSCKNCSYKWMLHT